MKSKDFFIRGKKSEDIKSKNIILACHLNTGSSWMYNLLVECTGRRPVRLLADLSWNEPEIDNLHLINQSKCEGPWISGHHMRFSRANLDIFQKFNVFPIIQFRNLLDSMVSGDDFLLRDASNGRPVYARPEGYVDMDFENRIDYLISFCLPWTFHFLYTWSFLLDTDENCCFVSHRYLKENPFHVIKSLGEVCGVYGDDQSKLISEDAFLAHINSEDSSKGFLNVGIQGRGVERIKGPHIEKIQNMVKMFTHSDRLLQYPVWEGIFD